MLSSYRAKSHEDSKWRAKQQADGLYEDYPAIAAEGLGLLFMGPVSDRKTHLAVAILRGLSNVTESTAVHQSGSLLKEIQDSYHPISQTSDGKCWPCLTLRFWCGRVGASRPPIGARHFAASSTPVITTRNHIFTTNYLENAEAIKRTLEDRIGVRLRSRLYEMCKTVMIEVTTIAGI